jgi:hypothetical protein
VNEFPWYIEVTAQDPITQGDFVEECPVLVYRGIPELADLSDVKSLVEALQRSSGIEMARAIVMTQACDIAWKHIRNVILCPIYDLEVYRKAWEEKQLRGGSKPTDNSWNKEVKKVKEGTKWNLAMLDKREPSMEGELTIPYQIVDFHEVFSIPLDFLEAWIRSKNTNRVRLLPPYREHLSQAFARFFMRVGLPNDIKI